MNKHVFVIYDEEKGLYYRGSGGFGKTPKAYAQINHARAAKGLHPSKTQNCKIYKVRLADWEEV